MPSQINGFSQKSGSNMGKKDVLYVYAARCINMQGYIYVLNVYAPTHARYYILLFYGRTQSHQQPGTPGAHPSGDTRSNPERIHPGQPSGEHQPGTATTNSRAQPEKAVVIHPGEGRETG